jgi:hypothetical protein
MSAQQQPEFRAAYVPPIDCKCGGTAMLVRTVHQRTESGAEEVRMFQCYACRDVTEVIVAN